jgi:hypothetical protein
VKEFVMLPIIGKGTREDPYRPKLPERIVNGVNELAVSWVALIPSDEVTGKPKNKIALVLVGTTSESKIQELHKHIEAELTSNPEFNTEAKRHIPDYGQRITLRKEEARDIGLKLDPKLKLDWIEQVDVCETP